MCIRVFVGHEVCQQQIFLSHVMGNVLLRTYILEGGVVSSTCGNCAPITDRLLYMYFICYVLWVREYIVISVVI